MLFRAVRWGIWFFVVCAAVQAAESVNRTPPPLYAKRIAPLLTPLKKALAARDAFPDTKTNGIILLDEVVHFRDDAGVTYIVFHDIFLARSGAAEKAMGNRTYSFDREHDSIFLISAATIGPDGTRHELGDRAAFIQSPQREADNGLYTSEQELNLIFPNIAAGAVTESIVLIREDKPVFPGEFASSYSFALGWPVAQFRLVADFPAAFMARVHAVKSTEQAPSAKIESPKGRTRHTWTRELVKEIDWEASGPELRFRAPTIWLTTLDSWDQVTSWFSQLAASRTTLGPELEKKLDEWTRGLDDRKAIVDRLASIVANDVRYTGLEFGLAGYQPYPCEKVWANRYGDCKDKANLLRALLARKGIRAHFLLLQSGGLGRVETRSPSWKQFNHVIVAVEDGADGYWYRDTTVRHLPSDHLPNGDAARDVLLVRDQKAEWRRTPDVLQNSIHVDADLALAASGELSGWFTLTASAGDAAAYTEFYNERKPVDRRRALEETIGAFYPGADLIDIDYTPAEGAVNSFKIRGYLVRKPAADTLTSVGFGYPASWLPQVDDSQPRLFPYHTQRRTESFHARIALPNGWNAAQFPSPIRIPSDSIQITADWQSSAGVLEQNLRWSPGSAELTPTDYAVFARAVRTLRTWLAQPVPLAQTPGAAAPTTAPGLDFPLLPSGAGQMRLLDQRFPSGERDTERRAALRQVLQWFPDDADTVLTARIYAALIDHRDDDATSARTIATIVQELGAQVPTETRAWARYLAARSGWNAAKDPSALGELETLAADTSLSAYRRSWSALYAARFHSESDPQRAFALLAQWDAAPSDARDSVNKFEAELLARTGDTTAVTDWARRLLAREDADHLFATALTALENPAPTPALEQFSTTLLSLLQPADRFNEALPQLKRLHAHAGLSRQRRELVAHLETWIAAHPRSWISATKSSQFADLAALEKHLDAMNDAHNAEATIDGALQVVRFHECDYEKFAKYLYWAAWWLENRKLDLEFLAFLARESHPLTNDEAKNIGEVWFRYAAAARAAAKLDQTREEYRAIVTLPDVRPFQCVEANGELGLLEIEANQFEEARTAFAAVAQQHDTHKRGSEYLLVGTMLALEQHEWDRALDYIGKIAATKKEYRDATKYAELISYLSQSSADPVALRRYWEQTAAARQEWDRLLSTHEVAPAALPLFEHITELQQQIAAAAEAKDTQAYVRHLDLLVRTALYVPIYAINACNQMLPVGRFAPDLQRELYVFMQPVLRAIPASSEATYWSARLWSVALLTDIRPPDLPAAAAAARQLYFEKGPSDAIRVASLLLWLNAATGADGDDEPIRVTSELLLGSTKVLRRGELVAQLAETLTARHRRDDVVKLLVRETQHADVLAQTAVASQLKAQLATLQRDASQGAAFTREVRDWLRKYGFEYFDSVPPPNLEQSRHSTKTPEGIYGGAILPAGEEAKCNLLLALDETVPMATRFNAFIAFHGTVGFREPRCERFIALSADAINLGSMPEEAAHELGSLTLAFLLRNGHPDAARQFLDAIANRGLRTRLEELYSSCFLVGRALADYTPARAKEAFAAMLAKSVSHFELSLLRALLVRTLAQGDTELASQLVESASRVQPAPALGQSAASVRLELLRFVRRESALLPFHRRIAAALGRHCPPTDDDRRAAAGLTSPLALKRAFTHQQRVRVIAAILADHLFPETNRAEFIEALGSATGVLGTRKDIGPALDHLVLTASELDDQTLAQWSNATALLSDFDVPEIRAQLQQDLQTCIDRPDVKSGTLAQRMLRFRLAMIALRTSSEKRPDAIFGSAFAEVMPREYVQILQFNYLASRQDNASAAAMIPLIDADKLSEPDLLLHARPFLSSPAQAEELQLLRTSALEKLALRLPELWFESDPRRLLTTALQARDHDSPQSLPDALFDHVLAAQIDDFERAHAELARAIHFRDWQAQQRAAEASLAIVPDFYELIYLRGEARFHLGDRARARLDLELFLAKALESEQRPAARRMLEQCAPSIATK